MRPAMPRYIHALTGAPADAALPERLAAPTTREPLAGILFTTHELVWRRYLKHIYLPYADIVWAYRQVEESHVSLGCCGGVLQEFRVILRAADGAQAALTFDREADAALLLTHLHAQCPTLPIGWTRENRARFNVT